MLMISYRGGLSNKLYSYRLSDHVPSIGDEPRCVLLRFFGRYVLENQQNMLNDSLIFAILAERNVGPKLYGVFAEGRLEEYIPVSGRLLRTAYEDNNLHLTVVGFILQFIGLIIVCNNL